MNDQQKREIVDAFLKGSAVSVIGRRYGRGPLDIERVIREGYFGLINLVSKKVGNVTIAREPDNAPQDQDTYA